MTTKLFLGTSIPFAAITISHATINAWLQTASLTIGIAVGVYTLINILRGKK